MRYKAARQLWHDEGWVFAKPDGRPLNPNTDYHEWKTLIKEAGLPERRLRGMGRSGLVHLSPGKRAKSASVV